MFLGQTPSWRSLPRGKRSSAAYTSIIGTWVSPRDSRRLSNNRDRRVRSSWPTTPASFCTAVAIAPTTEKTGLTLFQYSDFSGVPVQKRKRRQRVAVAMSWCGIRDNPQNMSRRSLDRNRRRLLPGASMGLITMSPRTTQMAWPVRP